MKAPTFGAPLVGARAWLGAALVLVAVRVGLGTIEALVVPGPWVTAATAAAALALLASAVTRTVSAGEWAPVAALVTGVTVIAVGYGGETGAGMPGTQTPGHLADLLGAGARTIQEGRIPVTADRGLELMLVIGAVAAAVVVDTLAVGLRVAGLAGVVLAGLWVPTLMFERPPSTISLLLGATSWLLLVWLTRSVRGPDTGPWRELPAASVVAAAASAVAVLLGPLAGHLPGYGDVRLPATWGPGLGGGSITLSDDLDMRSDLGRQSASEVLRYASDVADVGPLRTTTLLSYDGTRWDHGPQGTPRVADGLLWPTADDLPLTGTIQVTLTGLDQGELPIPVGPRAIDAPGTWVYDNARDEVTGSTFPGLTYQVLVAERDLSAEALRADQPTAVDPGSATLQVPDSPYADQIRALAREVTAGRATAYDQAMALQQYFRSSEFTYSTELAPAQTADPLWDFLQSKAGYCVQFATAMTIMARDLGIPARVGVGFLPGERGRDGVVSVTADRAHAWPELWFAGAGWVRFEPTPAVQTGAPPAYADPAVSSFQDDPEQIPSQPATDLPTDVPTQGQQAPGTGGSGDAAQSSTWPWLAAGGLLVVALGASVLLARRRRTAWGPEEAWALLRTQLAGRGVSWSDAATPRQAGALVRQALVDDAAREAIEALVRTLEAHRYSPHPTAVEPEELLGWVEQVVQAVSAAGRPDAVPSAPRSG